MQFGNTQPVLNGLLAKLISINTTVIALTGPMQTAYDSLVAANNNMVRQLQAGTGFMGIHCTERVKGIQCILCSVMGS